MEKEDLRCTSIANSPRLNATFFRATVAGAHSQFTVAVGIPDPRLSLTLLRYPEPDGSSMFAGSDGRLGALITGKTATSSDERVTVTKCNRTCWGLTGIQSQHYNEF